MKNFNSIYDNSQIATYQCCPMKYYLQYVKGLVPVDYVAVDLEFGSCVHADLEDLYTGEERDNWSSFRNVSGEKTKTKEGGKFLIEKYKEHYADDRFEILGAEIKLALELEDFEFWVKADTVIKEDDNIYGLEHKTTKSLDGYFDRYMMNAQISAQIYLIEEKFGSCSGIELNVLAPSYTSKNNILCLDDPAVSEYENVEVKYSSYAKYKRDMAYCTGYRARFDRMIITRQHSELEDWFNNMQRWVRTIQRAKETTSFPKSDSCGSCNSYRGCPYKQLCKTSIGVELGEGMLGEYKVIDPYEYLKEGGM